MALTGLQIYKLLPKTNCGECGHPTCLAFAMALAGKKVELAACPTVSDEAKAALGEASAPPIRLVTIGTGDDKLEIGNETVLFRHEQTFYHPAGLAILVEDTQKEPEAFAKAVNELSFDRVGQILKVNLIALKHTTTDAGTYAALADKMTGLSKLPLILMAENPEVLDAALAKVGSKKPLIYGATSGNWEKLAELAKKYQCPLAVKASKLEELPELTEKLKGAGVNDLVLDPGSRDLNSAIMDQAQIRRLALKKTFRSVGFPTIAFANNGDSEMEVMRAASFICKYAGIVVLSVKEPWQILPLLTLRQNIYTDPQKPIQVEAKLYELGSVTDTSPVLVTTNFSLSYFVVAGEIEASKIPSYLVIVDTDGTSVLTAWAGDKFNAEKIAQAIKKYGVEEKLKHKRIAIPGYVAVISGALEDESGWKVEVGPKEAAGIPAFLKSKGPSWS